MNIMNDRNQKCTKKFNLQSWTVATLKVEIRFETIRNLSLAMQLLKVQRQVLTNRVMSFRLAWILATF
jgi:hypothetical protein